MKVGGSISQSKQADLGIPQGGVLSVTLFLVAINGIVGELGNKVDALLFANDLAIYSTLKKKPEIGIYSIARSDQQFGCMGSREVSDLFP